MKRLQAKHTCGRVFNNSNAKSKSVAKVVVDKLRLNNDIKLIDIVGDIRSTYSTGITLTRAWRAKQIAKEVVEGDASRQYSLLWSYAAELRATNRRNTCKLRLENPGGGLQPRFGSFYMCLEGSKSALKTACRPIIGVDGCHLKTKYGGQLLIAVGRDPNDRYLPIAFAVVEIETKDSCRWFLNLLLEDVGDIASNRWVFISDQQKGLIPTFEEFPEGVEHMFCLRHMYNNFKKKLVEEHYLWI